MLEDFDPYDYAKAVRVLDGQIENSISVDLFIESINDKIYIDITNKIGEKLISLKIDKMDLLNISKITENAKMKVILKKKSWNKLSINYNSKRSVFDILVNDNKVTRSISFLNKGIPQRVEFRTGEYRIERKIQEYKSGDQTVPGWDEPNSEQPISSTKIYIDNFSTVK